MEPFLELCRGYETDLQFAPAPSLSPSNSGISVGTADVIAFAADSIAHDAGAKARAKGEGEGAIAMSRPDSGMATTTTSIPISPSQAQEAEAGQEAPDGQGQQYALEKHLPIRTTADLMQYADDVAGSIAAAICYLSYSILDSDLPPGSDSNSAPPHGVMTGITGTIGPEWLAQRPVEQLRWTRALHGHVRAGGPGAEEPGQKMPHVEDSQGNDEDMQMDSRTSKRKRTVLAAREMGRALQLVNIARDVAKDATINRLYIPLSHFSSARDILSVLRYSYPTSSLSSSSSSTSSSSSSSSTSSSSSSSSANLDAPAASTATQPASPALGPPPDYSAYNLPLLALATSMRTHAIAAIDDLPGTARGGTRAMVASYFQIAHAVQRERGRVDERGVRVGKWGRVGAAARAMWVGR